MIEVYTTDVFDSWFARLKDPQGKARIQARIDRLELGNYGNAKSLGDGISELRIHSGPGYRVYFTQRASIVVILLVGGDKSSQARDIQRARKMARELED